MQPTLPTHDVVLIGAGHTNLHIVRMWRMQPIPDVQLTLVSPFSRATYSGMLPGTLAGLYSQSDMEIDLYRLCSGSGVRLIVDEVVGLDPKARRLQFAERAPLRYDVASVGIGSVPAATSVWANRSGVLSIKPMATFLARLEVELRAIERSKTGVRELAAVGASGSPGQSAAGAGDAPGFNPRVDTGGRWPRVAVVGAGAAGVEVTFCLDAHLGKRGMTPHLTLIDSGDTILPGYTEKGIRLARSEFERRGITLSLGERVTGYENGRLLFAGGESVQADLVVWAISAAPPPVLDNFHLPQAPDGFLAVRPTLQTTAEFRVFVVGDTATLIDNPVPKAGVYAVREAPILWENIQRMISGRPLLRYDPQQGFLSLLATGDGRAIAQYKGLAVHNRWAWKLKDYIDRKFMRMYQDYRPMSPEMIQRPSSPSASDTAAPKMRCRGCGGKVGANVLAAALERIDVPTSDFVKQGLNPPDDAAVINPQAGTAEVLSVDFFPAFLDDPYTVGRVAALNSLSDLWATGARPLGAMAMVTLPEGPHKQQAELLYQLLAGGLRELARCDATLLGGHTTEGDELVIGYTVVGDLNGQRPFSKADLEPGDRLILTKPLGTGVLLAAHMESACRGVWMDAMLDAMLLANAEAARIAREAGITAVTDVTGFGLAGHLLEMLDASRVDASLDLNRLPLLDGFQELSRQGIQSSLAPSNREVQDRIEPASGGREPTDDPAYEALFDPQTSGGLLIGVPDDRAEELLASLREAGYEAATIIGTVGLEADTPSLRIAPSA